MTEKNTKAKYLLTDVTFEHEEAHLAYTLGTGAASQKNDPYILKSEEVSEEDKLAVEGLLKAEKPSARNLEYMLSDVVRDSYGECAWVHDFTDKVVVFYEGGIAYAQPYKHYKGAYSLYADRANIIERRFWEFDPNNVISDDTKKVLEQSKLFLTKSERDHVASLCEFLFEDVLKADGDLPNSAFAYVPDKDKTSTRKLRIDDANHVSAAVAALGKGFRGNKVDIPEKDLPAVKRKVKAAYKKFHPDKEIPEILKSVEVDALSVSNNKNADNGTTIKENIVEKVEISQEQFAEFQEMQKAFQALQKEKQAELKKSKEDIVKTATFIGDESAVVELLLKADESASVVEEIIVKAVEAINKAKEEVKAEFEGKVADLEKSLEQAKEEVSKTKEEFSGAQGIEGANKHENDDKEQVEKSDALLAFISENQDLIKSYK